MRARPEDHAVRLFDVARRHVAARWAQRVNSNVHLILATLRSICQHLPKCMIKCRCVATGGCTAALQAERAADAITQRAISTLPRVRTCTGRKEGTKQELLDSRPIHLQHVYPTRQQNATLQEEPQSPPSTRNASCGADRPRLSKGQTARCIPPPSRLLQSTCACE